MLLTISEDTINLPPRGEVILRHQTWEDYEQLLISRQDRVIPKIYFNAKTEEIIAILTLMRYTMHS